MGFLPGLSTEVWVFITSLALLIGLLLAWIVPHERAALVFSEAEIAFLFPAPIRRQTLVHYKLVRSQTAVLFTVFFLTLLSRWSGGVGGALMRAAGWWMLLSTINLHLLGSSFARTMLMERGITPWRRRALVLALATRRARPAAVFWAGREVPAPAQADLLSTGTVSAYLERSGAVAAVGGFADTVSLGGAAVPVVQRRARVRVVAGPGAARAGVALPMGRAFGRGLRGGQSRRPRNAMPPAPPPCARAVGKTPGPRARRRDPFRLSPTGPPAVAILWKNLLSAGQLFSSRVGLALLIWAAGMGGGMALGAGKTAWPQVIGTVAAIIAAWSVVLGPQFVRQDFRQDLAAADLLKMYPLRGWQMALGELLAPALILTFVQWVLIVLAATLLAGGRTNMWNDDAAGEPPTYAALAVSAAILVGPLNLVSLLIPNAAALLLPGWFAGTAAGGASRGVEVMGQRLLFVLAQFVALVVALLPAMLAAFLVYTLVAIPFLPPQAALPSAALSAALMFAAEAAGGLALLGHWFESYDLSAERPA